MKFSTTKQQVLKDIAQIIEAPVDEISEDTVLGAYVWDSMAKISVIAMVDDAGGSVEIENLLTCETVQDIFNLFPEGSIQS
jgi:acyl carrier protein